MIPNRENGIRISILNLIDKWGFLTIEMTAKLLNKTYANIQITLSNLEKEKFLNSSYVTNNLKKVYFLTAKASKFLNAPNTRYNSSRKESFILLKHQEELIDWFVNSDFKNCEYTTDRMLRREWVKKYLTKTGHLKDAQFKMFKEMKKTNFADMVIYDQENKIYVELERTAKTETQWKRKIEAYKASRKVFAFQSVLVQENNGWYANENKFLYFVCVGETVFNSITKKVNKMEQKDKDKIKIISKGKI